MIILGVDPGTATTGYGIIKNQVGAGGKKSLECLGYGAIQTTSQSSAPKRLEILYKELQKIIKGHKPDVLAVESVYFFKNAKTAIPVSQARGVILLAAAGNNIPVKELAPLQIKMGITGYGRAEKKQIQKMIGCLLNLKEVPKPDDAADALAAAICCARGVDRGF